MDFGKIPEMVALIKDKAASLKPAKKNKVDKGLALHREIFKIDN